MMKSSSYLTNPLQQINLIECIFRFNYLQEVHAYARVCKSWNRASKLKVHPEIFNVYLGSIGEWNHHFWSSSEKEIPLHNIHPSRFSQFCSQSNHICYSNGGG